jgi:hypothetical protein
MFKQDVVFRIKFNELSTGNSGSKNMSFGNRDDVIVS